MGLKTITKSGDLDEGYMSFLREAAQIANAAKVGDPTLIRRVRIELFRSGLATDEATVGMSFLGEVKAMSFVTEESRRNIFLAMKEHGLFTINENKK